MTTSSPFYCSHVRATSDPFDYSIDKVMTHERQFVAPIQAYELEVRFVNHPRVEYLKSKYGAAYESYAYNLDKINEVLKDTMYVVGYYTIDKKSKDHHVLKFQDEMTNRLINIEVVKSNAILQGDSIYMDDPYTVTGKVRVDYVNIKPIWKTPFELAYGKHLYERLNPIRYDYSDRKTQDIEEVLKLMLDAMAKEPWKY